MLVISSGKSSTYLGRPQPQINWESSSLKEFEFRWTRSQVPALGEGRSRGNSGSRSRSRSRGMIRSMSRIRMQEQNQELT